MQVARHDRASFGRGLVPPHCDGMSVGKLISGSDRSARKAVADHDRERCLRRESPVAIRAKCERAAGARFSCPHPTTHAVGREASEANVGWAERGKSRHVGFPENDETRSARLTLPLEPLGT